HARGDPSPPVPPPRQGRDGACRQPAPARRPDAAGTAADRRVRVHRGLRGLAGGRPGDGGGAGIGDGGAVDRRPAADGSFRGAPGRLTARPAHRGDPCRGASVVPGGALMARCRIMSTAGPAPSADTTESRSRRGVLQRSLDLIEDVGNKLPHPATLFAILAVLVVLVSWLLHRLDVTVHNAVEDEPVEVFDLLSRDGIQWMFTSAVDNFIGFAPLGVVLVTMLGIGMAEQTGLIGTLLRAFILWVPKTLVTAGVMVAAIMSSVASDAGYVVLPPLAAILFMALGRHPL